MADGFGSEICSGGKWWNNTARNGSSSCSTAVTDMGVSYDGSWSNSDQMAASSCDHQETASVSGSSIVYQDAHRKSSQESDSAGAGVVLMDSSLQIMDFGLSCPTSDHWTQALLHGSSGGRSESNFSSMLEESAHHHHQQQVQKDWSTDQKNYSGEDSSNNISGLNKQINQVFALDQQSSTMGSTTSSFLQGLFEPDHHHLQPQHQTPPNYENLTVNYNRVNSLPHQFLKTSSPPKHQLHFANNTAFWNASAPAMTNIASSFFPSPPQTQFEDKPNCSNSPTLKPNREEVREKKSSTSSEATFKRPRIETPTPLPTFKVRKEKLGDRITALQQLVSPFGKTDTASVLFEAIEYIKFLHEQVSALSTPYMKSGGPVQYQQMNSDKSKDGEGLKQDLRSRGLCLVPISITFPVTTETTADFWTPTFGGTYR